MMHTFCVSPGCCQNWRTDHSHDPEVPFPGNNLGENQPAFNASMSKVRISVESAFGDIVNLFKFTAFKRHKRYC